MPFELKDNSGALFKNDHKKTDKHPDYTGNVKIGGKEKRIAAWIKQGKKGKFMSLSFSDPQSRAGDYVSDPNEGDLGDVPF